MRMAELKRGVSAPRRSALARSIRASNLFSPGAGASPVTSALRKRRRAETVRPKVRELVGRLFRASSASERGLEARRAARFLSITVSYARPSRAIMLSPPAVRPSTSAAPIWLA